MWYDKGRFIFSYFDFPFLFTNEFQLGLLYIESAPFYTACGNRMKVFFFQTAAQRITQRNYM